jgi:hypothetical protein
MITRYAKAAMAGASLLLSLTAQASTYSFIGGATFDVYYDTAVLGNNVSLSGDKLSLDFSDTSSFYLNTNPYDSPLVVVPHAGYELSHYVPGIATATATLLAPGGWSALGSTALYGGTFTGGAFGYQNFVAETNTYGNHQLFLGDGTRNVAISSWYDIVYYDMDPGTNYAAYAVNFQGGASADSDDGIVVLHSPNVSFSFTLTGAPVTPVPETSTWLMMAAGLALLGAKARRSAA